MSFIHKRQRMANFASGELTRPNSTRAKAVKSFRKDNTLDTHLSFLKHTHRYLRESISFADKKTGFVFALDSAFLVVLHEANLSSTWIKNTSSWGASDVVSFFATGFLLLSSLFACTVVFPQTPRSLDQVIFWRNIQAHCSVSQYRDLLYGLDERQLADELTKHIFMLANICDTKYFRLHLSIAFGSIGIFLALALLSFF